MTNEEIISSPHKKDEAPAPGSRVRQIAASRSGKIEFQFQEDRPPRNVAPPWDSNTSKRKSDKEAPGTTPDAPSSTKTPEAEPLSYLSIHNFIVDALRDFFTHPDYGYKRRFLFLIAPAILLIIVIVIVALP